MTSFWKGRVEWRDATGAPLIAYRLGTDEGGTAAWWRTQCRVDFTPARYAHADRDLLLTLGWYFALLAADPMKVSRRNPRRWGTGDSCRHLRLNERSFKMVCMPRSPAQNEALRAQTRARLLTAALQAVAQHGLAGASMRSIAAQAGVAAGLAYAHFPSKEALLAAAFEASMAQVRDTFAESATRHGADGLAVLVRAAAHTVRDHLPFWQLAYAVRAQPAVLEALGGALTAWQDEILGTLADRMRAMGREHPALEARVLFAQIDGVCQHFAQAPADYPLDAVVDRVIAHWQAPVAAPPTASPTAPTATPAPRAPEACDGA
jgi:AcrR family transcriptional regulator